MRVSVWPSDSGYANYAEYGFCKVLLDGRQVKYAFTADEERGEVVRARLNADGEICLKGDEIDTETLYGKVEIIRP